MSDVKPARDIFSTNVCKMIRHDTPTGERPNIRAWAAAHGIDAKQLDRMRRGNHATTIDKIDELARACGLEAWQLLIEGFDPADPPARPMSRDDRITLDRLRRLLIPGA